MLSLLRYLIVLRPNQAMAMLPPSLEIELVHWLGTLMARNIGGHEAKAWNKAVRRVAERRIDTFPDRRSPDPWPLCFSLLVRTPSVRLIRGEPFILELNLFGERSSHQFFMGYILPALEQGGYEREASRSRSSLLGNYDVTDVYCAKGRRWEALVDMGCVTELDPPTPQQWCLDFLTPRPDKVLTRLDWVRPVIPDEQPPDYGPDMPWLLAALARRVAIIRRSAEVDMDEVIAGLPHCEKTSWEQALVAAASMAPPRVLSKPGWPAGALSGHQCFGAIPPVVLPFLELASILHLGLYCQYGYGCFSLG